MGADEKESGGGFAKLAASLPVITILASMAGLLLRHNQFELARPPADKSLQSAPASELRADSRSWQDPFQAINLASSLERPSGQDELKKNSAASLQRLSKTLARHAKEEKTLGIMVLLVDGSPFSSGIESRLRSRLVVHSAMRSAGYVRRDSDTIRYFVLPNDDPARWLGSESASTNAAYQLDAHSMIVPFEFFHTDATIPAESKPYQSVLALWIKEADVRREPFLKLAALLNRLLSEASLEDRECLLTNDLKLALVGPRTSDGLLSMINDVSLTGAETRGWTETSSKAVRLVRSARIISSTASAPDAFFLKDEEATPHECLDSRKRIGKLLSRNLPNCRFEHFGCTDEKLCFLLLGELVTRGIDLENDRIILLSEYDTFHGRALPLTFKAALQTLLEFPEKYSARKHNAEPLFQTVLGGGSNYLSLLSRFESNLHRFQTDGKFCAGNLTNVRHYSFLAGMDGSKSLLDNSKKSEGETGKDSNKQSDGLDRPEGDQQLDYMRRLADELSGNLEDLFSSLRQSKDVAAVGLLGGDFYDKLIILQGLREALPASLYFTTDLDARMNLHSQHRWTRNLLTASAFDLQCQEENASLHIAPFRDSLQTAMFVGCRSFLEGRDDLPQQHLGLFEIGRELPHSLKIVPRLDVFAKLQNLNAWRQRLAQIPSYLAKAPSLIAGLVAFGVVALATFLPFLRAIRVRPFFVGCAVALWIIGSALFLYWLFREGWEPLEIGDGVSALSSAILLCLAIGLGCAGLARCNRLDAEFAQPTRSKAFLFGVAGILLAVVLLLLPTKLPFRGDDLLYRTVFVSAWCFASVLSFVFAFFWIVFNCRLRSLLDQIQKPSPGHDPKYLVPIGYIQQAFAFGEQTEKCDRVLIFPMMVNLLIILASSPWTDSWHWSPWMLLLIGLNLVLLVIFQVILNRTANSVRTAFEQLLSRERFNLVLAAGDNSALTPLKELTDELDRGCFAPLAKQPVFGALAGVIGGSSIVSLLQPLISGQ
jgi:hypothetical protein